MLIPSLVNFELLKALFKDFCDVELLWGKFFVLKCNSPSFLFRLWKSISERCNHLVTFIHFNLHEGLNLINNVIVREYVARVDEFKQECPDALLIPRWSRPSLRSHGVIKAVIFVDADDAPASMHWVERRHICFILTMLLPIAHLDVGYARGLFWGR